MNWHIKLNICISTGLIALGITVCWYSCAHVCVCLCAAPEQTTFLQYVFVCVRPCVSHIAAGIHRSQGRPRCVYPWNGYGFQYQFDATPHWPLAFQSVFPIGHISLLYPCIALQPHRLQCANLVWKIFPWFMWQISSETIGSAGWLSYHVSLFLYIYVRNECHYIIATVSHFSF